ncbi:MAG: hypothetical protein IT484_10960 [Gammaproteobacteria bacterium]|nr:hypothetical protein [Gammaproteobacteria bacterium]
MRRTITILTLCILALQSASCGLLIYPERKGQTSGRIDPGVAILDAAGLIVFIVPGLVAFGVDFVTGCIYLPGGSKRAGADVPATVVLDPGGLDAAAIERAVQAATGQPVDLADPALEAFAVPDASAMQQALAAAR